MRQKFRRKMWLFLPIFIAAVFLFGFIVMVLWNAILPAVIGVKAITLWQALGILLLSKILFGGFHGGWKGGARRGRWMEMQQKLAAMTPEEREKFKQEWRHRCGTWGMRGQDSPGPAAE